MRPLRPRTPTVAERPAGVRSLQQGGVSLLVGAASTTPTLARLSAVGNSQPLEEPARKERVAVPRKAAGGPARTGLATLAQRATSDARSEAAAPVGIDPDTLSAIAGLPGDWHDSGNLGEGVVRRMAALVGERFPEGPALSAETGCGKSTLLFSRLSREHLCFTTAVGDSHARTAASPLLDRGRVRFVLGPSQRTLQRHEWSAPLDVALIDGGHGYPFPDLDYYGFYPQIRPGGLLVVDDIHIPTVTNLFRFLREDAMWSLVALEGYTAFFERTDAPTFDPLGDGWVHQRYNRDRFPHKEWLVPFYGPDWWLK